MPDPKHRDLLILDEPTAVLLPDEIAKLMHVCRSVADRGCAVVLVTHKLAEIKADCRQRDGSASGAHALRVRRRTGAARSGGW